MVKGSIRRTASALPFSKAVALGLGRDHLGSTAATGWRDRQKAYRLEASPGDSHQRNCPACLGLSHHLHAAENNSPKRLLGCSTRPFARYRVSGAHFNPAVSLVMWLRDDLDRATTL